jgi:hypothetical protein
MVAESRENQTTMRGRLQIRVFISDHLVYTARIRRPQRLSDVIGSADEKEKKMSETNASNGGGRFTRQRVEGTGRSSTGRYISGTSWFTG